MPAATNKPIICFGEILWDILPEQEVPGGAPMNVAYHLNQLGHATALFTKVGIDERGKALLKILHEKKIDTGFIQVDYQLPTGIVHANRNQYGEMTYKIVSPAAWDHIEFDPDMETVTKEAPYFVFGSLINRHKDSKATLMQLLEIAPVKVFDINLRYPFYKKNMLSDLLKKSDIVKLNIHEVELVTGWFGKFKTTEDRMQFLQDQFNIPVVIVTKGELGASLNYHGTWFKKAGYRVTIADAIGSGDAFLAAFLSEIALNKTPDSALQYASALGALVASHVGGWPTYQLEEIDALMKK
jgi:fructokinase